MSSKAEDASSNPVLPDTDGGVAQPRNLPADKREQWVYDRLAATSRSFAVVIAGLPNAPRPVPAGLRNAEIEKGERETLPLLRDAVALFYLALRALDTVEDDMSFSRERKVPILRDFYKYIMDNDYDWVGLAKDCGYGHEKMLLRSFHVCTENIKILPKPFQATIVDITKRMGAGMAEFLEREVVTMADYNLYCHYVAGLVGIGLSNLFADGRFEDDYYRTIDETSNAMGLCLQKTNITRDYLEDINDKRIFWPREVWSKYANNLADFKEQKHSQEALWCLNHLVTDAVSHLKEALKYMVGLRTPEVFNFCVIPQIMAVATLARIYNNHEVFTTVVKMPRSETMEIITSMNGPASLFLWYGKFLDDMERKISENDPTRVLMRAHIKELRVDIAKGKAALAGERVPSPDSSKL